MAVAPDPMHALALALDNTPHGRRGALLRQACEELQLTLPGLYGRLKRIAGWESGRKARSDKGSTIVPQEQLTMLAAMQNLGRRENGKQVLYTPTAASIMAGAGNALPVTPAHTARLLRQRKIGVAAQCQPKPVANQKADYPNHVHQVDPSLCLLYYMGGKQHLMRDSEFYKNKLDGYAAVRLKVWRYVLYDRASGALQVRYYEAAGENERTLFEFLMWAWARKPELSLHGVPMVLVWDKGSANTSASIQGVLLALGVDAIAHTAGNARAKGGVECAQNIVERDFESRLRFDPVHDIEQLNGAAWAWCEAYNAGAVHGIQTLLHREGLEQPTARYALWHKIRADQLRELPDLDVMRGVLAGRSQERKVRPDLSVTFKHPGGRRPDAYLVSGLPGVNVGDTVQVRPMLYGERAISLSVTRYDGEPLTYRLEPSRTYDEYGQVADAAVIGHEYKRHAATDIDRSISAMDAIAYPDCDTVEAIRRKRAKGGTPFDGELRAIQSLHEQERITWLPRSGETIPLRSGPIVEPRRLSALEASRELRRRGPNVQQAYDRITALYPEGVPEDEMERLVEALVGAGNGAKVKSA